MTEVSPPNRSMEKEEHRPHSHRYRRGFQNFLIIKQLTEVLLSYHDYVSLLYTKALGAVGGGGTEAPGSPKDKVLGSHRPQENAEASVPELRFQCWQFLRTFFQRYLTFQNNDSYS